MTISLSLPSPHVAPWQILLAVYAIAVLIWVLRRWRDWKSEAGIGPSIGLAAFVLFLGWIPFGAFVLASPWLIKDRFFGPADDTPAEEKEEAAAKVSV